MSPFDPRDLNDIPDPFAVEAPRNEPPLLGFDALPAAPSRSRVRAVRSVALGLALACEVMLVWKMGMRPDVGFDAWLFFGGTLLPALVGAALVSTIPTTGVPRRRVVAMMASAVFGFAFTTFLTRGAGDDSLDGIRHCIVGTFVMGIGPTIMGIVAMRRAFATGAALRTAGIGLATGLLGVAAMRLCCPNDAFVHVLVGHGFAVVLAAFAAVGIGRRATTA